MSEAVPGNSSQRSFDDWARSYQEIITHVLAAEDQGQLQEAWDQFWMLNPDDGDYGSGTTRFLVPCLRARNAMTVLCVGNGASLEAHALVHAGFGVDVLDVSSEANRLLCQASPSLEHLERILGGQHGREGGRMVVHTGDFRTASLCRGPFDVVISRRMLQYFPPEERPSALEALHARLAANGLLVVESQNARNSRKSYFEWLGQHGFAVYPDLQVQGKTISAPSGLCTVRTRPAAWVISSTG